MEHTDAPHLRGVLREIAAVFGKRVLEEGATVRVSWGQYGPDVSVTLVSDAGGGAQDVHRRCAGTETVGAREVARAGGRRCGAWCAPLETTAGVREVARARQTLPVQQRYGQHHGQHGGLPALPQKLRRDVVFVARSRLRTEAARAVQRTWRRACQVTRLRHVRLVAHMLQAQWRRHAATPFAAVVRRQQENTVQDTPSILLEDAETCHGRLVARTVAARAVQRSWRRARQVTRFGQVRLVALGLQAQWRRRAATRIVASLLRCRHCGALCDLSHLTHTLGECLRNRYLQRAGAAQVRAVPSRSAQRALEMQAQAQALVRAQVDNNYKSKTRTRSAEPQNKTFISLPFSSRSRSLLSPINGASSRLPSPPSIVDRCPCGVWPCPRLARWPCSVWRDAYGHS